MKIKNITAREILDSNGNPTIETTIELWSGDTGTASVPSGTSTGSSEVLEMRDNDKERYNGKGVLNAVEIVNTTIKDMVKDQEFQSQKQFDDLLIQIDGSKQKSKLGGNTILSCSLAFCRAVANSIGLPLYEYISMIYWGDTFQREKLVLPIPQILVLEGAKHGNWATDIQEYMIVPNVEKFKNFSEMLRASTEIYKGIEEILKGKRYSLGTGFEGAFAPQELKNNKEPLEIIVEGISKVGYTEKDFTLALDIAASEFFNKEKQTYDLRRENISLNTEEWLDEQIKWYKDFPVSSLEDVFDQEDWNGWTKMIERFGKKYQIVGDDLLTTNVERIGKGLERKAMNAVLIKLNQIGTLTETLDAIRLCVSNGMEAVISHRSGETTDTFIADLSVATPATYCKFGGPNRGERVCKYNRLMEIEGEI